MGSRIRVLNRERRSAMPKMVSMPDGAPLTPVDFAPREKTDVDMDVSYDHGAFYRLLRSFRENKLAMACAVVLVIILFASIFAFLSPYDPDDMDVTSKMAGVSAEHLLGTDDLGRDLLTRALYGGRVSISVGIAAMVVSVLAGTLVGSVSGYVGGKLDVILMRIVDMFLSVPSLLLIIVIYAFVPTNMVTLVLMLALFSWTNVARVVRAQTLTLKERDFVLAAKSLGVSHIRIIFTHIIPNMTSQIIVAASLSIANAILDESALSFLGYGVQLPKSSWGSMLQNAQKYILYDPLLAVVPGMFILLTVLCFNILGDALQHALDPRLTK